MNIIRNFEDEFGVREITTAKMKTALQDWIDLYYDDAESEGEDNLLRLPVEVVKKIYKAVFPEYKATPSGAQEEFIGKVIEALDKKRKKAVQQALIGGEVLLKPIVPKEGEDWIFSVIPRQNYIVLGRDIDDKLIDAGFYTRTVINGLFYTLFERRTVEDGHLVIRNKLFSSRDIDQLGSQVALTSVPRFETLVPELHLDGVTDIGLIHMKCPGENTIDESPDGVAIYAAATNLIHRANENEAQFSGEFERGKSRIFASDDLFRRDPITKERMPLESVFVKTDTDPETGIQTFSPALRFEAYLARKNAYLYDIESLIGIKHGLLAKAEEVEKTATEITSSAGDYALTVKDFQDMWDEAVRDAVRICAELSGEYMPGSVANIDYDDDIQIAWGNGVLYDEDKTWAQYLQMVSVGMLKPELALAWYFDLPHDTEQDIQKIRTEYMPAMEQMMSES